MSFRRTAWNDHCGSALIDAFGKALEARRQFAQALLDRGRRSFVGLAPSLGRLATEIVRRHALGL
jgi:hypothetical protein